MKKTIKLLFLFLFLNSFAGKAQQYVPLVVDGAHWIVESCDADPLPPVGSAWEYYILGDTTVNTIQYKKVYSRAWSFQFCSPGQPISTYQLFSLIREDTLTEKVYSTGGAGCPSGNDTLLYGFDVQIGDTLAMCLLQAPKTITTITQGNVWLLSKTYGLSGGSNMYEGVGSDFGLFELMEPTLYSPTPRLAHYCREGLSNCGLILSVESELESLTQLSVYPNPSNNYLIVEHHINNYENVVLEIFSINGKKQLTKIVNNNKIELDVSTFPQGIYFIQLKSNKKIIATQKWVKMN